MARADLTSLLGKLPGDDSVAAPAEPPVEAPFSVSKSLTQKPAPLRPSQVVESEAPYLAFVRKDTRLRADQLEALTVQARRLNRARRNNGIRITENTLIRIAVDLLLGRVDRASGDDEAALLRSLR